MLYTFRIAGAHFAVPQHSVLGPLLFSLHPTPLSKVIERPSGINFHFCADDTQLFVHLSYLYVPTSIECAFHIFDILGLKEALQPNTWRDVPLLLATSKNWLPDILYCRTSKFFE